MCIGIKDWTLTARCLYCDALLVPVNGCNPSSSLAVSIVRCDPCRREYELTARLTERRRPPMARRRAA